MPPGSTAKFAQTGKLKLRCPASTNPPQAEQAKEDQVMFGPVVERVINVLDHGNGREAINLIDGKLVDVPKEFVGWPPERRAKWAAENNVDLIAHPVSAQRKGQIGGVLVARP